MITQAPLARPPLNAVLAAGLAWLDTTPQHPDAICNHHGASLAAAGGRSLQAEVTP